MEGLWWGSINCFLGRFVRWKRVGGELGRTGGGREVAKTTMVLGFRLGVREMNSGSGLAGFDLFDPGIY